MGEKLPENKKPDRVGATPSRKFLHKAIADAGFDLDILNPSGLKGVLSFLQSERMIVAALTKNKKR